jgi:maleate isomerase
MMPPNYPHLGAIGVATPQANPTVEPEFQALAPPGVGVYVTRLTSRAKSSRRRLSGYLRQLERAVLSFDSLPLKALGFACTGSSYLLGRKREAELIKQANAAYPILTATGTLEAELDKLQAQKISLVSPYPEWLNDAAVRFWRDGGRTVTAINRIALSGSDTRGIYDLTPDVVRQHLKELVIDGADVVLISGTGLPSLDLIRQLKDRTGLPVLSANACLAAACFKLAIK